MSERIVPAVHVDRTVLHRAYGILPLVAVVESCSFHDTSARETEHARIKGLESLCDILAETVLVAVECLDREERDVLEVHSLGSVRLFAVPFEEDTESCLWLGYRRCEHSLVLLPFLGVYLYVSAFKHLLFAHRSVLAEVEADVLLFLCTGSTCPYSEAVFLSFLDTDSEESLVLDTCEAYRVARIAETYIMRISLERTVVHELHVSEDLPSHERVVKLERAVLDLLGVKTSVGGEVDVLEEETVHCFRYRNTFFSGVNCHQVVRLRLG